jgi:CemA family
MFVGFHSAEGWEVSLEGIGHHFGLPESKLFIYTFIAIVPVMLDSVIKFWIFTYFTRYSAAGSAIYERMNT